MMQGVAAAIIEAAQAQPPVVSVPGWSELETYAGRRLAGWLCETVAAQWPVTYAEAEAAFLDSFAKIHPAKWANAFDTPAHARQVAELIWLTFDTEGDAPPLDITVH